MRRGRLAAVQLFIVSVLLSSLVVNMV